MSMNVQFHGRSNASQVNHISVKTDGTVVLRFDSHKEYIQPDEHAGFNVVTDRAT